MDASFHVQRLHFFPGIHSGLSAKTAIVDITCKANIHASNTMEFNFGQKLKALAPADDYYLAMTDEWEKYFLLQPKHKINLAHWIVGATIAIQLWARHPVCKGKVLNTSDHTMQLAIPWERQDIFESALYFALAHILSWSKTNGVARELNTLASKYTDWLAQTHETTLSPNSLRFALAAKQRNIPVTLQENQIHLGSGKNALRMDSSFTSCTGVLSSNTAKNKLQTNHILRQALIPVPDAILATTYQNTLDAIKKISFPLVIKPLNQDQGVGITTNIKAHGDVLPAFNLAIQYSPQGILIEQQVKGDDFRLLVVNGRHLMASKRLPGGVIGDGKHSVQQLLAIFNRDPKRGEHKRSNQRKIALDSEVNCLLQKQNLSLDSIPEQGAFVRCRHTANISTGGTAVDVTEQIHPDNCFLAERAAQVIGLDIAGIDFLSPDISKSWREVGGAVIEVNAQPGFRPHWVSAPDRDINGEILECLFQGQTPCIPTAAITGTNGKTTTAKMLHHIWMTSGKNAGVSTTNGLWIGKHCICDQNLSGHAGGRILLSDPTVEAAIIEMPRKSLIFQGHPSDQYDVAALLNIQNDHIGVDGINSLEEMAKLKSEVIQRAKHAVVINAEDELCMQVAHSIKDKKYILVSINKKSINFSNHLKKGGSGLFTKIIQHQPWIVMVERKKEMPLMPVAEIPATLGGLVEFNISNAMFAAGLAWAQDLPLETIRMGLSTFTNSVEQNPGRMNFIEGYPFKLLLDFSHNPDTLKNLTKFIQQTEFKGKKSVLIQNVGNRHRGHIKESMAALATTFDAFMISCDAKELKKNPEWCREDPVKAILKEIKAGLLAEGIAEKAIKTEPDCIQGIKTVIAEAEPEDLLVLLAEPNTVIPIIGVG